MQDEGRDSKTQGATKGEITPRGVTSKPTTLSPRRHLILTPRFGPAREWLLVATWRRNTNFVANEKNRENKVRITGIRR